LAISHINEGQTGERVLVVEPRQIEFHHLPKLQMYQHMVPEDVIPVWADFGRHLEGMDENIERRAIVVLARRKPVHPKPVHFRVVERRSVAEDRDEFFSTVNRAGFLHNNHPSSHVLSAAESRPHRSDKSC
jgi:hypothetical protein